MSQGLSICQSSESFNALLVALGLSERDIPRTTADTKEQSLDRPLSDKTTGFPRMNSSQKQCHTDPYWDSASLLTDEAFFFGQEFLSDFEICSDEDSEDTLPSRPGSSLHSFELMEPTVQVPPPLVQQQPGSSLAYQQSPLIHHHSPPKHLTPPGASLQSPELVEPVVQVHHHQPPLVLQLGSSLNYKQPPLIPNQPSPAHQNPLGSSVQSSELVEPTVQVRHHQVPLVQQQPAPSLVYKRPPLIHHQSSLAHLNPPSSATAIIRTPSPMDPIYVKIAHNASIIMLRVSREISFSDLKRRIHDKFVNQENLPLTQSFSIVLAARPQASLSSGSVSRPKSLEACTEMRFVDHEADWRRITAQNDSSKITLRVLDTPS